MKLEIGSLPRFLSQRHQTELWNKEFYYFIHGEHVTCMVHTFFTTYKFIEFGHLLFNQIIMEMLKLLNCEKLSDTINLNLETDLGRIRLGCSLV